MNTQAHTPTPWVVGATGEIETTDLVRWVARSPYSLRPSDAAHIVKCVNAHDELVAALRKCDEALSRQMLDGTTFDDLNDARTDARAILAKVQA